MSKDILLVTIAGLGWLWAVAQFFLNRSHQRKDKILDRRYTAYAGYLMTFVELIGLNAQLFV